LKAHNISTKPLATFGSEVWTWEDKQKTNISDRNENFKTFSLIHPVIHSRNKEGCGNLEVDNKMEDITIYSRI